MQPVLPAPRRPAAERALVRAQPDHANNLTCLCLPALTLRSRVRVGTYVRATGRSVQRWHVQCRRRVLVLRLPGELHQCLRRVDVHVQLGLQHLGLWCIPRLHPYARHRVETRVWACFLTVDRLRRMRNRMHGWHLCERRRLLKYDRLRMHRVSAD